MQNTVLESTFTSMNLSHPTSTTIIYLLSKIGTALKPSFTLDTFSLFANPNLNYTASLDGLRGFAAFSVFTYHYLLVWIDANKGYIPGTQYAFSMNLPFINFLKSGQPNVAIFYTISGYVLSYRCLNLLRTPLKSCDKALSSSVFRRFIRLYIPSIVYLFILSILYSAGINESGRKNFDKVWLSPNWYPSPISALWEALNRFFWISLGLMNVWDMTAFRPVDLDPNLWTIRVEYQLSMFLFLLIIGLSKLKRHVRLSLAVLIMAWAINGHRPDAVLFVLGYIIADFDVEADHRPHGSLKRFSEPDDNVRYHTIWCSLIVFALYMLSFPSSEAHLSLGYQRSAWIIYSIFPIMEYVPHFFAAPILLYGATNYRPLSRFFSSNIIQYLGKISFALYIVHGPIVRIVGHTYTVNIMQLFGASRSDLNWNFYLCLLIGWISSVIITVPLADLFTIYVTEPAADVAKWVENMCLDTT